MLSSLFRRLADLLRRIVSPPAPEQFLPGAPSTAGMTRLPERSGSVGPAMMAELTARREAARALGAAGGGPAALAAAEAEATAALEALRPRPIDLSRLPDQQALRRYTDDLTRRPDVQDRRDVCVADLHTLEARRRDLGPRPRPPGLPILITLLTAAGIGLTFTVSIDQLVISALVPDRLQSLGLSAVAALLLSSPLIGFDLWTAHARRPGGPSAPLLGYLPALLVSLGLFGLRAVHVSSVPEAVLAAGFTLLELGLVLGFHIAARIYADHRVHWLEQAARHDAAETAVTGAIEGLTRATLELQALDDRLTAIEDDLRRREDEGHRVTAALGLSAASARLAYLQGASSASRSDQPPTSG